MVGGKYWRGKEGFSLFLSLLNSSGITQEIMQGKGGDTHFNYWNDYGNQMIFGWTSLIVSGLSWKERPSITASSITCSLINLLFSSAHLDLL